VSGAGCRSVGGIYLLLKKSGIGSELRKIHVKHLSTNNAPYEFYSNNFKKHAPTFLSTTS
jgi:hypothetical protein